MKKKHLAMLLLINGDWNTYKETIWLVYKQSFQIMKSFYEKPAIMKFSK